MPQNVDKNYKTILIKITIIVKLANTLQTLPNSQSKHSHVVRAKWYLYIFNSLILWFHTCNHCPKLLIKWLHSKLLPQMMSHTNNQSKHSHVVDTEWCVRSYISTFYCSKSTHLIKHFHTEPSIHKRPSCASRVTARARHVKCVKFNC